MAEDVSWWRLKGFAQALKPLVADQRLKLSLQLLKGLSEAVMRYRYLEKRKGLLSQMGRNSCKTYTNNILVETRSYSEQEAMLDYLV